MKFLRNEMTRSDPLWITVGIKFFVKMAMITIAIGLLLFTAAVVYGYPAPWGQAPATGAPQTKGEWRAYAKEFKAHDDRLIVLEDKDITKFYEKLKLDADNEWKVAHKIGACVPCIVYLPPPDPSPALEVLTPLVIPEIPGADDEAVTDEDRKILDSLEIQHDENQNRATRNEDKKWAYLLYFEARLKWYTDQDFPCPVVPTPPAEEMPPGYTPPGYSPPHYKPPYIPPVLYKRDDPQYNPTTGDTNEDPGRVDETQSEPAAEQTDQADEPY